MTSTLLNERNVVIFNKKVIMTMIMMMGTLIMIPIAIIREAK